MVMMMGESTYAQADTAYAGYVRSRVDRPVLNNAKNGSPVYPVDDQQCRWALDTRQSPGHAHPA